MKGIFSLLGLEESDLKESLGKFQALFDDVKKCLENQAKIMEHLGIDQEESEDGNDH